MAVQQAGQEIIRLLQADMRGEHQAIVQYLLHAYALGESGQACEIEAIARDEMRHFRWLADAIVELGGEPTLERDPLNLTGTGPADWMSVDVDTEQGAIDQYKAHIAAIADPKIKRLLGHILADEEVHKDKFAALAQEIAAAGVVPEGSLTVTQSREADPALVSILQGGVRHEYTVILQYLFHRFMIRDWPVADALEQQAITEMRHLGWLSEKVAGLGLKPDIEHTALALRGDILTMLKNDIAAERAVAADYTRQAEEVTDPQVKSLLTYMASQEQYHDQVFTELLEKLKAQKGAAEPQQGVPKTVATGLTVGSLLGERQ